MTTMRQKRKTGTLIGVIIAIAIAAVTIGPAVAGLITGPDGYVRHAPSGAYKLADWVALMRGDFAAGKPTVTPEVAALDGKLVYVSGFTLPMHLATEGNKLYMTPKPGNCYYCNPPSQSEVVEIDIRGGKSVPLIGDHLYAYGKFKVATSSKDAALYTLQDAVLREAP